LVVEYVEANPFVVIGGLVVDRHSRRRGIGRLLMEDMETWAKEHRTSRTNVSGLDIDPLEKA
jgi:GNAT superfamily N-acetyltransferase